MRPWWRQLWAFRNFPTACPKIRSRFIYEILLPSHSSARFKVVQRLFWLSFVYRTARISARSEIYSIHWVSRGEKPFRFRCRTREVTNILLQLTVRFGRDRDSSAQPPQCHWTQQIFPNYFQREIRRSRECARLIDRHRIPTAWW